jgi:hypothetical protein
MTRYLLTDACIHQLLSVAFIAGAVVPSRTLTDAIGPTWPRLLKQTARNPQRVWDEVVADPSEFLAKPR